MIGACEFCGREKELGEGTPFHGNYCAGCLRLNIENDQETLKKMKVKRRNKVTPEELRNLEAERDRTIERLIGDSEKAYKIT